MKFTTRHIGGYNGSSSKIIELTVEGWGSAITEDITNSKGYVDEELISQLRNIADELEEQNQKLSEP